MPVEFNDAFFVKLGKSPEVTALCVKKAEEIAAVARARGPRDTEDYVRGIVVRVEERNRRNAALVVATDEKSLLVESFSGNLARALKQVSRG